jgi:choline dehydrogenase
MSTQRVVDVLIVGGGSAGAVMASRLSERIRRTVVLLEAGRAYPAWAYPHVIASSDTVGGDPEHDWGFRSEAGYVPHPINAIRGKVLGGSSAVNGAVAIRARPQDFRNWGLPGWSYEDMLASFKRLERRDNGCAALHGYDGPLPVRQLTRDEITPMQQAFIDAVLENGYREWHLLKLVERVHIFGRARARCDEVLSATGKISAFVFAFVVRCDRGDSQHETVRSA